jgi:O-succinylbenzoate synthase
MATPFRGLTYREGVLFNGPAGWGEFSPFVEYNDVESAPWLTAAVEQCTTGWPRPVRDRIPINCTVPAVGPEQAHDIVAKSGCRTAKVKVADHPGALTDDMARLEAVRSALGQSGAIRVDANGCWDVDAAISNIRRLDRAAGGLEYVEQPCRTLEDLALVRRNVDVRIAADESIRRARDPFAVAVAGAADIIVLKCAPLGGVSRALRLAQDIGLPCVVSSALETSVGLSAQVALAGALPELEFACGLGTLSLLRGDVVSAADSLVPVDGYISVRRQPPAPHPAQLEAYRQRERTRVTWWHNRLSRVSMIDMT